MTELIDEIISELLKRLNIKKAFAIGSKKSDFEKRFLIVGHDFECVIIRELSNTLLGNLAQGSGGTDEKIVLDMLLKRKKVYVIKDGIEFLKYDRKSPLYLHYSRCLRKIKEYGADIIGDTKILTREDILLQKNLGADTVICDKNTIITPLAQDCLIENNMTAVRR